jgi:mevalonate kinase
MHNGTPSGIDNTVIVMNAPVYFVRGQQPQPFGVGQALTFVIANTGVAASTKETVGAVRKLVEQDAATYETLIDQIGQLVREARTHIERGYLLGIGHLMNLNHQHLCALTVSSPLLDALVEAALEAGALGAKLSGGGRGGNMIALVNPADAEDVAAALRAAGAAHTWTMTVSE